MLSSIRLFLIAAGVLAIQIVFVDSAETVPIVFINEFHYDNIGDDVFEGVEIAGPAGTNLTDWRLYFYRMGSPYKWIPLSGIIPNQMNGYGTLNFLVQGIEDMPGTPPILDAGMALVDDTGFVHHKQSYEGGAGYITGPGADPGTPNYNSQGAMESDLTTPIGYSIQMIGTGQTFEDFKWTGPVPHSRGLVNVGQTFIPEPSTFLLTGLGLGIIGLVAYKRQKK